MQTWYWRSIQDFFCIQMRYSQFHCSLLIILFGWISKYMHFLLTLRVQCRLTSNFNRGKICNTEGPKKETKETTKTKAPKHTTNIINQAIITYYCYSHHNMHAHLSTQVARETLVLRSNMLWRCALKLYSCVEGVGVTEATPSTGWTVAGSGWIHRWGQTWRSSSETQKSRPPHHQAYEGNRTRPKNEMTWQDNSGRLGLLALPFSNNKDQ